MILDIQIGSEYYVSGPTPGIDWAKWIGTGCSIVTLILAWKIYKTFDVHKKFAEKQLSVVFDFIAEFQKIIIVGAIYQDDNATIPIAAHNIEFSTLEKFISTNYKNILSREVCIKTSLLDYLQFNQYASNPFMPKSIAKEIEIMSKHKSRSNTKYNGKEIYLAKIGDALIHTQIQEDEVLLLPWQTLKGYPYENLDQYLNQLLKIKNSVIEWLKKYGAKDFNLIR